MDAQTKRHMKTLLYEQFARMGKALANPHRLELLDVLAQGERSVEGLAAETGMSVANASQHLQTLRLARLVETRRDGTSISYRLASDQVSLLWLTLRTCGKHHLAEIDQLTTAFFQDRTRLQAISLEALRAGLQAERILLVDVRPHIEFQAGHLPQARSFPLDELEARLAELLHDREIVAYCRGPYCLFADEALTLLHAHGYAARRLEGGGDRMETAGLAARRLTNRRKFPCSLFQ